VRSECHGGASSDRWVQEVSFWRHNVGNAFSPWAGNASLDLLIIDTGLTDGHAPPEVKRITEILYMELLAVEPPPAILQLSASGSRFKAKEGEWEGDHGETRERQGDAAASHAAVARWHGVPQVSAIDALAPLRGAAKKDWFNNQYTSDEHGALSRTAGGG